MQSVKLLGHLRVCHGLSSFSRCFLKRASTKQLDWYSILGVKSNAEQKEIKENFYKLSKEFHPDLNKDDESSLLKFKEIAQAYEVLSSPEQRKEYDKTMGFGINRDPNGGDADGQSRGGFRGYRRRFTGMKGVFRDGKFVDDELPPQMRNIEYDLSAERMEKLWARYKARWDRVEEVERLRELEKKKVEFRRRVDLKREKMDQMNEEEKADFLHKLRLLRTDIVDDEPDEESKNKQKKESTRASNIKEEQMRNQKIQNEQWKRQAKEVEEEMRQEEEEKRREEEVRRRERVKRREEKDMRRLEKKVMMEQLGISEEKYNQIMEETVRSHMKQRNQGHFNERDNFYDGLNSSNDAADWRSFMGKTYESNKDKWERVREGRNITNKSYKHGLDVKSERNFGNIFVLTLACCTVVLMGLELSHSKDFDE